MAETANATRSLPVHVNTAAVVTTTDVPHERVATSEAEDRRSPRLPPRPGVLVYTHVLQWLLLLDGRLAGLLQHVEPLDVHYPRTPEPGELLADLQRTGSDPGPAPGSVGSTWLQAVLRFCCRLCGEFPALSLSLLLLLLQML